jgi:hypothetical protein
MSKYSYKKESRGAPLDASKADGLKVNSEKKTECILVSL